MLFRSRRDAEKQRQSIQQSLERFLRAHQRVYANSGPSWDGRWLLVSPQGHASAAQKSLLKKELLWEGFALLAPGLFACPGDKQEALAEVLMRTRMNGKMIVLSATDPGIAGSRPLEEITSEAWPLKETARTYKKFIARFEELKQMLTPPARLDSARAFTDRGRGIKDLEEALPGSGGTGDPSDDPSKLACRACESH